MRSLYHRTIIIKLIFPEKEWLNGNRWMRKYRAINVDFNLFFKNNFPFFAIFYSIDCYWTMKGEFLNNARSIKKYFKEIEWKANRLQESFKLLWWYLITISSPSFTTYSAFYALRNTFILILSFNELRFCIIVVLCKSDGKP